MVLIQTEYILVSDLAYSFLKASKRVYNCLVQPMFDYTVTVWGGLSIGCSNTHTYFIVTSPKGLFRNNLLLFKSITLFIITNYNTQLNTYYNTSQLLITMFLNLTKKYLQNFLKAGSLRRPCQGGPMLPV